MVEIFALLAIGLTGSLVIAGLIYLFKLPESDEVRNRAVWTVGSAEGRNAGARIPGAGEDCARIAKVARVNSTSNRLSGVSEMAKQTECPLPSSVPVEEVQQAYIEKNPYGNVPSEDQIQLVQYILDEKLKE
jgi:hypothetical protein